MCDFWNSLDEAVVGRQSSAQAPENTMTMEELEKTLPNGLHDSRVIRIAIDYEQRKLALDVAVWVGDLGADAQEQREEYRPGQVLIDELLFAVIEPPDPTYPFSNSVGLTIDGCDMRKNLSADLISSLPADAFFQSIWVNDWNAFIHIGAKNARLVWTADASGQGQKPEARS
jgi:hypothetical protein